MTWSWSYLLLLVPKVLNNNIFTINAFVLLSKWCSRVVNNVLDLHVTPYSMVGSSSQHQAQVIRQGKIRLGFS